jgi:DNA-binding MurR/RpiR family transcriptional regulator
VNPSSDPSSGIIETIRAVLPTLPGGQRSLAEVVLADPATSARLTIVELADRCQVSTGTITRFCRALSLDGYAQLRISLAADSGRTGRGTWSAIVGADVSEDDEIGTVANLVCANVVHVVTEAIANLDLAVLERAATALATANRVQVFGVGGSGATASEFQQRLYRIGTSVWAHSDLHIALTGAALMGPGDVVVAISHSGQAHEVCDLLAEAGSHSAHTIAVTNDPDSAVARRADLVLATEVHQVGLRNETILARHAQLAVLDLLYVAIAQRTFDRTREAMAVTAKAVQSCRPEASGR